MNYSKSAVLCFLLLVYFIKQDAFADKEDKSEEVEDLQVKLHAEENSSLEISGPLDSHEAMNNRDINSRSFESNREKRSYEFLMGLVNNNSKFEVTNVDVSPSDERKQNKEISVNESILELIVKIAANPEQWEQVHKLLQNIDKDLITSRKLIEKVSNTKNENLHNKQKIYFEKKYNNLKNTQEINNASYNVVTENQNSTTVQNEDVITEKNYLKRIEMVNETNKMIVILNGENKQKSLKDHNTKTAIKSNKWPEFQTEGRLSYKSEPEIGKSSKFPFQLDNKSGRNFAYHRVTGYPLHHTNVNKNPKAYIAISVIAPKPFNSRPQEDLILENELRQLKPWTHQQNLKNMEALRSRWIIQSEKNKSN